MARSLKPYEKAEAIWHSKKVECPICNQSFDSWYCPNCGIPKNNSGYTIYEDIPYYCGSNHFRQDDYTHDKIKEYKLCIKCYTPNSQDAKYCRNCCVDISSQARNKHGIGWVDLGLSVLWSADPLNSYYIWNDHNFILNNDQVKNSRYTLELSIKAEGKDPASYWHGEKWRTPTKEEFEELITNCTWEKCLLSTSFFNRQALKAIGPNGNSIIIPTTDYKNWLDIHLRCDYWTSSSVITMNTRAYFFYFQDWYVTFISFASRLNGFDSEFIKEQVEYYTEEFINVKDNKNSTIYKCGILVNIAKLLCIIKKSIRVDKKFYSELLETTSRLIDENRDELWMETLPKLSKKSNLRTNRKTFLKMVLPVADKKWQGKL